MPRREYAGAAAPLRLTGSDIDASATTLQTTGDPAGWPTGASAPFYAEIDRGVAGKAEKILVLSRSGNTLTVAGGGRGADGTVAQAHTAGAVIEHVVDAGTINEANAHVNDTARDDHPGYLSTTRHDTPARHVLGTSISTGVPGASAPGDSASEGVSTAAARADHRHQREAWGAAGDVHTSYPGDTALGGGSGKVADANHRHAREPWGDVGDIHVSYPGDVGLAGSSNKVAQADHRHPREPWATVASISLPGQTYHPGSVDKVAREDHYHGREETYGLTYNEDKNDGDTSPLSGGNSITVATYTLTIPRQRTIEVDGFVNIRNNVSGSGSFAGYVYLTIGGSGLFGGTRRFNSYPTASAALPVSWRTKTQQAAGTYTFAIVVALDAGSPDVIVNCRDLTVFAIGGAP